MASGSGEPPPKDEKGLKGWIRNKLKALASLLGKLGMKAAEALPGIIGGIISWILNRAKDVVGWVSHKEDKNSIPQCIGQSHITTSFSNMVPFPSRTHVRQMCAQCAAKTIKFYDIHGKRKEVMPICTGYRTFAGQTYYDGLS